MPPSHRPTGRTRASGPSPKSSPTQPASAQTPAPGAPARPRARGPVDPPDQPLALRGHGGRRRRARGRSCPARSARRTACRASLTTVSTRHEPDRSHAFQATTVAPLGSVASDNPDASSPGISNGRARMLRPRSATTTVECRCPAESFQLSIQATVGCEMPRPSASSSIWWPSGTLTAIRGAMGRPLRGALGDHDAGGPDRRRRRRPSSDGPRKHRVIAAQDGGS